MILRRCAPFTHILPTTVPIAFSTATRHRGRILPLLLCERHELGQEQRRGMRDGLERLDLAPPQRLCLPSIIVRVAAILLWWWCKEARRVGVLLLLVSLLLLLVTGGRGSEGRAGLCGCRFPCSETARSGAFGWLGRPLSGPGSRVGLVAVRFPAWLALFGGGVGGCGDNDYGAKGGADGGFVRGEKCDSVGLERGYYVVHVAEGRV